MRAALALPGTMQQAPAWGPADGWTTGRAGTPCSFRPAACTSQVSQASAVTWGAQGSALEGTGAQSGVCLRKSPGRRGGPRAKGQPAGALGHRRGPGFLRHLLPPLTPHCQQDFLCPQRDTRSTSKGSGG
uniref:Uncharacterized protein n=1 Tax=Rousettus aegyptiacus TaxID=9407 RepID=A0A7J8H2D8_ROUAE|nr:hypothetical protein HJG63_011403 [Rousettus aegyptiacus]